MIKLIGFLYSGCWHKWKIIDRQKVDYKGEFSSWTADRYVLIEIMLRGIEFKGTY